MTIPEVDAEKRLPFLFFYPSILLKKEKERKKEKKTFGFTVVVFSHPCYHDCWDSIQTPVFPANFNDTTSQSGFLPACRHTKWHHSLTFRQLSLYIRLSISDSCRVMALHSPFKTAVVTVDSHYQPAGCHDTTSVPVRSWLVRWCLEPSQLLWVTSGMTLSESHMKCDTWRSPPPTPCT